MVLLSCIGMLCALTVTILAVPLNSQPYQPPRRLLGSSFAGPTFNIFDPSPNATFDYVVVGGGNAGIPMAVRLAEAGHTVALIEGGSFYEIGNSNFSQVPVYAPAFSGPDPNGVSPMVDWNFTTTPQTGQENQIKLYPRGKTLGGSSARNYQTFQFGTNGSYHQWANMVGDETYQMSEFTKYLHKPVNYTPPASSLATNGTARFVQDLLQNKEGPLRVTSGVYTWAFSTWARLAFSQVGIKNRKDGFTAGALVGNSYTLSTVDPTTFTRDSSETSYLQRLGLQNPNLVVYPSTLAKRILFNSDKKAIGVEVDFGGLPRTLYARKEVVLSGGVFQSPQLLMVSGIGPKATLDNFNIPVVAELAGVGQNMWDHVVGGISYRVDVVTTARLGSDPAYAQNALDQYLSEPPRGPLTTFASDVLAFEKLPKSYRSKLLNTTLHDLEQFPSDWPELEFIVNSAYGGPQQGYLGSPDGLDYGSLSVALVAPFSRGNVTIQSANMADKPIINPNWLTDPRDQDLAVQGWHRLREIFSASSIKPILIGEEAYPGLANTTTDAQILDHVRSSFGSVLHAACTCKMGRSNDTMAVVDSQARVYGVTGLRVVDASSFPLLPPGHPQATVYGLAEKIADSILNG